VFVYCRQRQRYWRDRRRVSGTGHPAEPDEDTRWRGHPSSSLGGQGVTGERGSPGTGDATRLGPRLRWEQRLVPPVDTLTPVHTGHWLQSKSQFYCRIKNVKGPEIKLVLGQTILGAPWGSGTQGCGAAGHGDSVWSPPAGCWGSELPWGCGRGAGRGGSWAEAFVRCRAPVCAGAVGTWGRAPSRGSRQHRGAGGRAAAREQSPAHAKTRRRTGGRGRCRQSAPVAPGQPERGLARHGGCSSSFGRCSW